VVALKHKAFLLKLARFLLDHEEPDWYNECGGEYFPPGDKVLETKWQAFLVRKAEYSRHYRAAQRCYKLLTKIVD
jgi:hypothetical protein